MTTVLVYWPEGSATIFVSLIELILKPAILFKIDETKRRKKNNQRNVKGLKKCFLFSLLLTITFYLGSGFNMT